MRRIFFSFRALYFATLLMLTGSGLLSTYLARLAADKVDGLWVGALMAANYFGLVLGGKVGHRLIARVGHIRAYVACAGVVTAAVLGHGLLPWLPAWIALRMVMGLGLMCQYMVIELAQRAGRCQPARRGVRRLHGGFLPGPGARPDDPGGASATGAGIADAGGLLFRPVPGAAGPDPQDPPAALRPAPLEPRFFIRRVPQSLTTVLVSGLVVGSFYGLAPLYANQLGLPNEEVGLYMGACIFAGLLVQWPLGWLSDRRDRAWLIRACAILLCLFALPLALLQQMPLALLLALGIAASMLQFTLYPLAVAFSNDHVETERRVSLTAMLLVTFGVGACIGPLAAGALMRLFGANMLYAFVSACALILVWRVHPEKVSGLHRVDDAPLHHVPTPDNMTSSRWSRRSTRG